MNNNYSLQLASYIDRFVGCISKYFEPNRDEKKSVYKQGIVFRNPRTLLFGNPGKRKHVRIKPEYTAIYTGKSKPGNYNTPQNPRGGNKTNYKQYCKDSICSTLTTLSYYFDINNISAEEYYSCIDSMIEGLSDVSTEIEESIDVKNLIDELSVVRKSILNDQYGTKVQVNYNYNHLEYKEMDIKLSLFGLEQALTRIREVSLNGERIRNYINVIMVRLLLTRYVRQLENKRFCVFFNDIVSEIINEDAIAKFKYFDFMFEEDDGSVFDSDNKTKEMIQIIPEREDDAKRFLLASDFDFWLNIINAVGDEKSEYKYLNTETMEYMDSITNKLKMYRNKVSHSGDNDPSPEMVVRTLRTILDFAEKSNLKEEAVLVKKHLLYEMYRCYDYDAKHSISYRYDLDFSSYCFQNSLDIPSWKEVCPVIIDVGESIESENKESSNWRKEIKEIFFGREELKTDVVDCINTFYTDTSIALPFFSLDGFCSSLRDTYPFHPCFFLLIKNLKLNDKIELARRAIKKALDDNNYNNPLIMPYEIDLNQEIIHDLLVSKFDVSETKMGSDKRFREYGWEEAQLVLSGKLPKEIMEKEEANQEKYTQVVNTVLLLNLRELFRAKTDETISDMYSSMICANKEWIRLCCYQPGRDIKEYENTLNLLKYGNFLIYYREGSFNKDNDATVYKTGIYQILFPSDDTIKHQMNTVFDFYKRIEKLGKERKQKLWQLYKDIAKNIAIKKMQEMKGIISEEDLNETIEDMYKYLMKENRKDMAIERVNIQKVNKFWFYAKFLQTISDSDQYKFTI